MLSTKLHLKILIYFSHVQLKKWRDVTNSLATEGKTSGRTLIHTKKNNRPRSFNMRTIWRLYFENHSLRLSLKNEWLRSISTYSQMFDKLRKTFLTSDDGCHVLLLRVTKVHKGSREKTRLLFSRWLVSSI